MDQLVQVVGALLILIAFVAAQMGAMNQHGRAYLTLNLVGSVILTILAVFEHLWGFLMLEAVWAVVSARGLFHALRGEALETGH